MWNVPAEQNATINKYTTLTWIGARVSYIGGAGIRIFMFELS